MGQHGSYGYGKRRGIMIGREMGTGWGRKRRDTEETEGEGGVGNTHPHPHPQPRPSNSWLPSALALRGTWRYPFGPVHTTYSSSGSSSSLVG